MADDDPEKIANASLHQRASLMAEIERLTLENWQLKGALGYPVPSDVPDNGPFKCGLCDAKTRGIIEAEAEVERLRALLPITAAEAAEPTAVAPTEIPKR